MLFFFFKQKTAYEMRISDWSSDVCSSDLLGLDLQVDRNHSIFNILRAPEFARYARQTSWPTPLLLHLNADGHEKALLVQLTRYGLGQFLVVTRDVTQVEKLETTRKEIGRASCRVRVCQYV